MAAEEHADVVLIGAGIMSATLGTLLAKLEPSWRVVVVERLDQAAAESSDAWNNAGTGHSGFCELNYTPQRADGSVDVDKAIDIAAQFSQSIELWSALIQRGDLPDAASFIRPVPHVSFVVGDDDVAYLRARHAALVSSPFFADMEFTTDPAQVASWAPLVMEGRAASAPVAATRVGRGSDVNFGALTRALLDGLVRHGASVLLSHEVHDLKRDASGWVVDVEDRVAGTSRVLRAPFVFIGAGGYSLSLLEKSGVPEAKAYGAFPVSGQWLRCNNRDVIERHHAKVYGKADVGAPPMSVPHLDSRWINGQKELLFGPYAGFTTKFLKEGSFLDLLRSVGIHNVVPVMNAGLENLDLTRYLVGQALLSVDERIALLRRYYPGASGDDWELQVAGLRVQIIKGDGRGRGELKFGTEVVTAANGSIAALLGASPGASTAASIMLGLLRRCFPDRWSTLQWQERRAALVPSSA